MKKLALFATLCFAGAALAQEPAKPAEQPTSKTPATSAVSKTHDLNAEFVAADAIKKTLTIKTGTGESTVPMEGKALTEFKSIKAGEKVVVTCKDDSEGKHVAAVAIKPAAPKS